MTSAAQVINMWHNIPCDSLVYYCLWGVVPWLQELLAVLYLDLLYMNNNKITHLDTDRCEKNTNDQGLSYYQI